MTLQHAVEQYASFRKTLGERFNVSGRVLKAFCRAIKEDTTIQDVTPEQVSAFLRGAGPLTASWFVKHNALLGFYRYAISREFVGHSPLPKVIPKRPPGFHPYIYSKAELFRLIDATSSYQRKRGNLEPITVKTLLLLIYSAALRASEILSLTYADVDLHNAVLRVRDSKFFKSRLVPLGPMCTQMLTEYAGGRSASGCSREADVPFFVGRKGKKILLDTLDGAFQQLRKHAGLSRSGGPRCQPRLHDLRHTSAVDRLTAWYREGKDVQRLLLQLSVYMGHKHLASTQVYLTMTPELLQQASSRFELYSSTEGHHG
jgi:site-specific recombinase XerD